MADDKARSTGASIPLDASSPSESDEELAVRCDNAAFVTLYRRHLTGVYRYLYSRLGEVQEAENLTGSVFERAWSSLGSYKPTGSFKGWLFTIASHTLADHYRHSKRSPRTLRVGDHEVLDTTPGPEESVLATETLQMVLSVIATLPPDQQEVISLRFMAELPYKEIARVMGKREAAVKMSAYRALESIRRRCADVYE